MITLCGFGVSNYYNKLKLVLLEKQIPFRERTVYPWERASFVDASPLGKIPFIETEMGGLSESQVILEYLEDRYPEIPLYPAGAYARAKCRELIQHLELNGEWVARRLYKECFFGGTVSRETRQDAHDRLVVGLEATASLAKFSPFVLGAEFTAADCAAYVHFTMIRLATVAIYGEDMIERYIPEAVAYMARMDERPHIRTVMADRAAATTAFIDLNVPYDG
ncbi:MAG: glutathione S-transferase [Sphingomonas bacterium]